MLALLWLAIGSADASSPSYDGPRLRSFAFVASDPEVVFAAGDGVYRSSDGGMTWVALKAHQAYDQVLTDPHDARRVIAFRSLDVNNAVGHYLESVDGGVTWTQKTILGESSPQAASPKGTNLDGFLMHLSRPGVWVALVEGKLWTTANSGVSWEVRLAPVPVPMRGRVVATRDAFYVASASQVWRSEEGVSWQRIELPAGEKLEQIALAGADVVIRTDQGWWQVAEARAWVRVPMLSAYERRYTDEGSLRLSGNRRGWLDHCYPRQSAASTSYLFATCSSNNVPMSFVIDYGVQQHSFDGGRNWTPIGGVGLPSAWFPTAVGLHPRDSATLLVAWVTGRVFRSEDHGETWRPSDSGLVFPVSLRGDPEYGLAYLRETKLNQAVMLNDAEAIKWLAAEGVNLDEPGVYGKTAIEWALLSGSGSRQVRDTMYWQLRDLGAAVPAQSGVNAQDVFLAAARAGFHRVVEDMVRSGWSLSAVSPDGGTSPLMRAVYGRCSASERLKAGASCRATLAGKPLAHWVDHYLSHAQPGRGAQLVIDLVALGEPSLASRVADFDAGKYRDPKDVLRLLKELPAEASAIRSQIFHAFAGRYGEIASNGDLYAILTEDMKKPEWVLEVLPLDHGPIRAQNASLLVEVLLRELKRPDWAKKILRGAEGPRIDAEGYAAIAAGILDSCDREMLAVALKAGLRLNRSAGEFGWSPVRYALWSCSTLPRDIVDSYIAMLHRMGLRLPRHEWEVLNDTEAAVLRRSALGTYYRAFEGQTAGVGISLKMESAGIYAEIDRVIPSFPAGEAGIKPGDLIAAVDDVQTKSMSLEYVLLRIRGKPGTKVKLTVMRNDGQRVVLHLRRRSLQSVDEAMPVKK